MPVINDNCACMFLFELKCHETSENPKTNQFVSLSNNYSSYISFVQSSNFLSNFSTKTSLSLKSVFKDVWTKTTEPHINMFEILYRWFLDMFFSQALYSNSSNPF